MKIRNQSEWQLQLAELAADPDPHAIPFRNFLVSWGDAAESYLDGCRGEFHNEAIHALRNTLGPTEERVGRASTSFIGMALLLLYAHWDCGYTPDEFYGQLGPIEQHLLEDIGAMKAQKLMAQAQEGQS